MIIFFCSQRPAFPREIQFWPVDSTIHHCLNAVFLLFIKSIFEGACINHWRRQHLTVNQRDSMIVIGYLKTVSRIHYWQQEELVSIFCMYVWIRRERFTRTSSTTLPPDTSKSTVQLQIVEEIFCEKVLDGQKMIRAIIVKLNPSRTCTWRCMRRQGRL